MPLTSALIRLLFCLTVITVPDGVDADRCW